MADDVKRSGYARLGKVLWRRTIDPFFQPPFVFYVFTGVVLFGGLGVWVEIVKLCLSPRETGSRSVGDCSNNLFLDARRRCDDPSQLQLLRGVGQGSRIVRPPSHVRLCLRGRSSSVARAFVSQRSFMRR